MLNQFSRTQLLLGKGAMDRLQQAHVAVFGIGGVGADEYGLSGATIYGGKTGLYMAWARMFLLLIGSFLAFLHIFED